MTFALVYTVRRKEGDLVRLGGLKKHDRKAFSQIPDSSVLEETKKVDPSYYMEMGNVSWCRDS